MVRIGQKVSEFDVTSLAITHPKTVDDLVEYTRPKRGEAAFAERVNGFDAKLIG